jgi:hypothetical protein
MLGSRELEDVFKTLICGLTGLAKKLVQPAFQPASPVIPPAGASWIAFVLSESQGGAPEIRHQGADGEGMDVLNAHLELRALLHCYGPQAAELAQSVLDGLYIEQNRAWLRKHEIGFTRGGPIVQVPAQTQWGWLERRDLPLYFTRRHKRAYAVLNLKSAQAQIKTE